MRRSQYTKLKVNMLLLVVAVSAGVAALVMFLIWSLEEQAFFSEVYYLAARNLFGQTAEEADAFFAGVILPNRPAILCGVFALSVLAGLYRVMGTLTRWFDRVGDSVHEIAVNLDRMVTLPRELAPLEAELNGVRLGLLQREQEAADSAQRAKDLVVYLAHDLKTPLTSVVGYLNLLREQPEMELEQRVRYTGIALEKAKRLEELMGEFFDINRLDLDTVEKSGQILNLTMMLEQLADEFWPLFEEKGLTFHCAISEKLNVWGDPDKLVRVFDNVLRNAVNYSIDKGVVGLRAFRQGGELVITVDNEGVEIPEKELSNIFQKFYRLDAARSTRTGGFGLGLAIAKEIVERHRGSIRAESDGKRVTFTIILPAR